MDRASRSLLCCLIAAFAWLGPAPVSRADEPLVFGLPQEPPWTFEAADGSLTGISYDTAQAIAERSGLAFTYVRHPFIRSRVALENGSIDLALLFPSATTQEKAIVVAPITMLSIIILPGASGTYRSLGDFEGKTVAVQRGTEYDERLTGNPAIRKHPVTSFASGLKMTEAGRVAGVAGSDVALFYTMKTLGMPRREFGPTLILTQRQIPLLLGKRRATSDLVQKLKAAADTLRNAGVFDEIMAKYTAPQEARRQP